MRKVSADMACRLGTIVLGTVLGVIGAVPGTASALDRRVKLINESGYDLIEFYASNIDDGSWGRDRLGTRILWSGDSMYRNIDDGSGYCRFDFKAVFEDYTVLERHDVNVCAISEYYYY